MLPIAAIERIARNAGVKRISKGAVKELQRYMDELASELTIEISELTRHAGRKTIKKEDVRLAVGKN